MNIDEYIGYSKSSIDNSAGDTTSCTELSTRTILNSGDISNRIVHTSAAAFSTIRRAKREFVTYVADVARSALVYSLSLAPTEYPPIFGYDVKYSYRTYLVGRAAATSIVTVSIASLPSSIHCADDTVPRRAYLRCDCPAAQKA